MSYLVLARKWRPQTFDEIVGQKHISDTLSNAIRSDRVAHAFLFTGVRGVGKTTAARVLAKALNCEKGPTPKPCNKCSNCLEVTAGNCVDVLEVDGASNTGVNDVREIIENVRYQPAKSRFKIYIIDEVHMLSTSAFNALLKTLEEPPPHVKFIFATTDPHKVPHTIHSRCQRYDFRRIPARLIVERLAEIAKADGIAVSERGLYLIAREAEGSMRDAQSLFDQVIAYAGKKINDEDVAGALGLADRALLFDLAAAIIERNPAKALEVVERLHRFGYDLRRFVRELLEHVRNLPSPSSANPMIFSARCRAKSATKSSSKASGFRMGSRSRLPRAARHRERDRSRCLSEADSRHGRNQAGHDDSGFAGRRASAPPRWHWERRRWRW
jgi:DNA polymerase-3 subunit gamma/tau